MSFHRAAEWRSGAIAEPEVRYHRTQSPSVLSNMPVAIEQKVEWIAGLKPRALYPYVGGVGPFRVICQEVADKGYEGLVLTSR